MYKHISLSLYIYIYIHIYIYRERDIDNSNNNSHNNDDNIITRQRRGSPGAPGCAGQGRRPGGPSANNTPSSHSKNSLSKICSKGWVAKKTCLIGNGRNGARFAKGWVRKEPNLG